MAGAVHFAGYVHDLVFATPASAVHQSVPSRDEGEYERAEVNLNEKSLAMNDQNESYVLPMIRR